MTAEQNLGRAKIHLPDLAIELPSNIMWSGSYSQQYVNPQNLEVAEQELEMFMDLYNRILANCRNKCIPPKYHEPDLSKGEMVCIDRCVAKYMSVQKLLGKKMEENAENLTNIGSTGGGLPSTL